MATENLKSDDMQPNHTGSAAAANLAPGTFEIGQVIEMPEHPLPLIKEVSVLAIRDDDGALVRGLIGRLHLSVFKIPHEHYQALHDSWRSLLMRQGARAMRACHRTQGEALFAAVEQRYPEITQVTCQRWALLMYTIAAQALISERDAPDDRS